MTMTMVKFGRRWVVVTNYGCAGGAGQRSGHWCDDELGGWGVGSTPEQAVGQCGRPVTYPTKRTALAAIAEALEYAAF